MLQQGRQGEGSAGAPGNPAASRLCYSMDVQGVLTSMQASVSQLSNQLQVCTQAAPGWPYSSPTLLRVSCSYACYTYLCLTQYCRQL
jgi:hypothetical protein